MSKKLITLEDVIQNYNTKNLNIIKRKGHTEPFNVTKLLKVINWATQDNENFTKELLLDTKIKLYNDIRIVDLYNELINTASNKISLMYSQWEYISARLFLLKIYKDVWQIETKDYPNYSDVIKKGLRHHIYDHKIINTFTDDEIDQLDIVIKASQSNDLLFTWKSLNTIYDKYCLNYTKTKKLELPQHVYMRVAIALHYKSNNKISKIIECYNNLATHKFTVSTPIALNGLTINSNYASCVLSQMDDDTHNILDVNKDMGIYSKYKGGTACDITRLRSKLSYIKGNQGYSSGTVPFIKIIESTLKAFNQGGKRTGSCNIFFQWWHHDFKDLIVLKSNTGTDDNRARSLKYAVKLNNLLIHRVIRDEDITLFDPKDVPKLFNIYGDEFDKQYIEYENKVGIRKSKMKASDLWYMMMKERAETSNIYLFHEENVNNHSMLKRYINSSNLCMEILEPSRASKLINETYHTDENGKVTINKSYQAGEIALCNLSSINLLEYFKLSESGRAKLIFNIVETLDNSIDLSYYPVKEGKISNLKYRYLGIGVNNYTNYLATLGIIIDSEEALTETHRIFDEISYNIINSSMLLAKSKGKFAGYNDTKWGDGVLPVDICNKRALELGDYNQSLSMRLKWDKLRIDIKYYGVRNALMLAIMPTATSGKSINATESIEPISNLLYKESGTKNITSLVPNFRKNNKYYKNGFECNQEMLVKLAAIRQCYIDQSQSLNLYFKHPDSLYELSRIHLLGFEYGVKTYYYMKQLKSSDEEICESCS